MPASAVLALVWHMEQKMMRETDDLTRERLRVMIAHMQQESMQRALRQWRMKTTRGVN